MEWEIIEMVPMNQVHESSKYYIHHSVVMPSKSTTKVRVVYDTQARKYKFE